MTWRWRKSGDEVLENSAHDCGLWTDLERRKSTKPLGGLHAFRIPSSPFRVSPDGSLCLRTATAVVSRALSTKAVLQPSIMRCPISDVNAVFSGR